MRKMMLLLVLVGMAAGALPSAVQAQDFEDCGYLIQGVECVLFDSDNFGTYVLWDYGTFVVGDYVYVVGTLDPDCITTCMQGDGCIVDNTIDFCVTPTRTDTWGTVKSLYR
jgi:hypothetical protein